FVADVVDELVFSRMTGELESASHHPFVEPFQPSETSATLQIHELRMHNLLHRRVPTQRHVSHLDAKHAHPARRDHGELEFSVVDDDKIDTFLFAAMQDVLAHRPRSGAVKMKIAIGSRPFHHVYAVVGAGKCLAKQFAGGGGCKGEDRRDQGGRKVLE